MKYVKRDADGSYRAAVEGIEYKIARNIHAGWYALDLISGRCLYCRTLRLLDDALGRLVP